MVQTSCWRSPSCCLPQSSSILSNPRLVTVSVQNCDCSSLHRAFFYRFWVVPKSSWSSRSRLEVVPIRSTGSEMVQTYCWRSPSCCIPQSYSILFSPRLVTVSAQNCDCSSLHGALFYRFWVVPKSSWSSRIRLEVVPRSSRSS